MPPPNIQQRSLFPNEGEAIQAYNPRPASLFQPRKIVLAKGSVTTTARRRLVDGIVSVYPKAEVMEQPTVPHNKVHIEADSPLNLHYKGHRVLVLGEHQSAVGRSDEEGNTCPNFWHFSPYGFCPYGCSYCYLSGTQGVRFSPSVKIYVNLAEILAEIDRVARRLGRVEAFYLGKLQDGMALDPLTGYSRTMIPFFAKHPYARLRVLSKSADFDNVLDLDHQGNTVLCWSLNPSAVRKEYEVITEPIEDRIQAIRRCAEAGYPVRIMLMPIIPIPDWQQHYDELLEQLLTKVKLDRITLGGICSYGPALQIMEAKLGKGNLISRSLTVIDTGPHDGRTRYPVSLRSAIYRHLLKTIRRIQPELTCALCMEDVSLARDLGLGDSNIGRCNCIL
jgi:spore photoproduct lyase